MKTKLVQIGRAIALLGLLLIPVQRTTFAQKSRQRFVITIPGLDLPIEAYGNDSIDALVSGTHVTVWTYEEYRAARQRVCGDGKLQNCDHMFREPTDLLQHPMYAVPATQAKVVK